MSINAIIHGMLSTGFLDIGQRRVPINWSGKTAVFMGDSTVVGFQASVPAKRWTSLFCNAKGATESNLGVSGTRLIQDFFASNVPIRTVAHQALFIAYGINDMLQNNAGYTPALFKSKYQAEIPKLLDKGWDPKMIVLCTPNYMTATGYATATPAIDYIRHEAFNQVILEVCQQYHLVLADFYTQIKNQATPASFINADGIHPVDSGYSLEANYLLAHNFMPL